MGKLLFYVAIILGAVTVVVAGGCTRGKGTSEVKLIDVTWEGFIFKTCEVDVQYGNGSSRVEMFSSESKELCDALTSANGKDVMINYNRTNLTCVTCGSSDLIQSFTVK